MGDALTGSTVSTGYVSCEKSFGDEALDYLGRTLEHVILGEFGDEVKVVFEDDEKDITYHFSECYKVKIEHAVECPKDRVSKELTFSQIPYFMQDVELKEIELCQKKYMEFKINMYPIELLIVCKKFDIY